MQNTKTKKPKQVIEKITIHYKHGETKTIEKGAVAYFTETEKKGKKYQKISLQFLNIGLIDAYPLINTVMSFGTKLGIIKKQKEG